MDQAANKVWTSDELKTLKRWLDIGPETIRAAASRLDRPLEEVDQKARELGWLESPPLAPK